MEQKGSQKLIQNIQAAVVVHSADTIIIQCNRKAQELLGLTEKQMVGKKAIDPCWNFLREDGSRMPIEEYPVNKVLKNNKAIMNYVIGIRLFDKPTPAWVLVSAVPEFNDKGCISEVIVTFMDITEFKEVEKESKILKTAVDQAPVGIALADEDINIYYCNPEGLGMRGGNIEELVQIPKDAFKNWQVCMLDGEPYEIEDLPLVRAIKSGETIREEFIVKHQDGTDHICDAFACPVFENRCVIGGLIIFLDITDRKRAEESIKNSEDKLQHLLQTIQAGVVVHDAREGRVRKFNTAAMEILGLTEDQILGRSTAEPGWGFVHEDGEPMHVDEYPVNIVKKTKKPLQDYIVGIIKQPDNNLTWAMVKASPQFDKDGNVSEIVVSSMDITSIKKMASEKALIEQRYRKIFHQSPIGIAVIDSISGAFLEINEAYCEIIGWKKEDILQTDFMKITHPNDLQKDLDNMESLKEGKINKFSMDKRYVTANGGIVWVSLTVVPLWADKTEPLHHLAIVEDITEQREYEQALKRNANTLKQAQRTAKIGSWWYDPVTEIPTWTEEMFHIFGLEPNNDAISYKEHRRIIHPGDWDRFDSAVKRAINRGIGYNLELRVTCPDGKIKWARAICDPVKNESGKVVQLIGTTQDITAYKQYEKCLEEYRRLIEESDDQFAVIDKNYRYTLVNNKYAQAQKLNLNEILNHHIRDVLGDDYYENYAEPYLVKAFRGIPQEFEATYQHGGNDTRHLFIRYYPIKSPQGKIDRVAKVILDITKQKKAEEIRDQILTLSQDLICIAGMDGYFKYVNPAWEKVVGYSTQELLERPFLDFIHPDDHGRIDREVESLSTGKNTVDFENRYICKNGSIRYFLWTATPIVSEKLIYCIGRDITDRKSAEEKIISQTKNLEAIFNSSPNILMIIDKDGRIRKINKHGIEHAGRNENEILGFLVGEGLRCIKSLHGKACGLNPDCFDCPIRSRVKSTFDVDDEHLEEEAKMTFSSSGVETTFDLLISTSKLEFDGEENVLLSLTDISQIKEMERKNIMLESKMAQSQKIEAIGNLAGGIAHDFNNILSSIIGFTELALEDIEPNTIIEDSLKEVYSAGKRAKDLVKQILAFARQSEEKIKPIQPIIIAKEVVKFIRSTIPASIEINSNFESSSHIIGNPTQLHQVLMNLCTNAACAMEDQGGVLSLSIKDISIKDNDTHSTPDLNPGNYVEIVIADTGVGIEPGIINSIFEPYFTTKAPGEGTGMGLAVVYGIVVTYGGKITVDSQLGKGTTFTIYFPSTRKKEEIKRYIPEKVGRGNERILFVDDEFPIVKMNNQILRSLGYSVTTRTSSIEALELFRSKHEEFDLVVTDMTMPNMTGDKLAVELMKIRPDIPVVLCTGFNNKISEETVSKIGIKALLYKPVVKADLGKVVRKVLDEAKG